MGGMKTRRHQSGFISIHLLAIVVGLLLITGVGQSLWRGSLNLGMACHEFAGDVGVQELADMCDVIGRGIASFRNQLEQWVGGTQWGDYMDLEDFAGMIAREFSSNAMRGFNAPQLSGLINFGGLSSGGLSDVSKALTQGSIGSNALLKGDLKTGIPYLRSSAGMGDVGVLSQLSLGSAYANGTGGLPRDLRLSRHYNNMALGSIKSLQRSSSPDARRMLSALPASPDAMVKSLSSALK